MSYISEPQRDSQFVARPTSPANDSHPHTTILIIVACVVAPLAIAAGFGTHNELYVCAAIMGIAGLWLGLAYPFAALVFFVAMLYVRPEESIPVLRGMHFTLISSIVASISVVLQKLMDREAPVKFPVNPLIIGFGVIIVLSTMKTGSEVIAIQDAGKLVALMLMVCNLVRTPARYHALSTAVVAFTAYLALFSVCQYYAGVAFHRGAVMQALGTGIFQDPNDLSATIVAGVGLALCRAAATRGGRRVAFAATTFIMVWAIYLTNSRGGMMALVATLAAFVLIFSRSRWIALALVLMLAAGAVKFGPSRVHEIDTREESANSRFRFWHRGTLQFISNPVTGVGYGEFLTINNGFTAHNTFVLCYTELGLPGYFCWMGCLYYAFRGLRRRQAPAVAAADASGSPAARDVPAAETGAAAASPAVDPAAAPIRAAAGGIPAAGPESAARAGVRSRRSGAPAPLGRKAPTSEALDRTGAKLALAGFLLAGFWISRTYSPVLYLLIALPLAQQIAYGGPSHDFSLKPRERWLDTWTILGLCVASITFIALLALKLKN